MGKSTETVSRGVRERVLMTESSFLSDAQSDRNYSCTRFYLLFCGRKKGGPISIKSRVLGQCLKSVWLEQSRGLLDAFQPGSHSTHNPCGLRKGRPAKATNPSFCQEALSQVSFKGLISLLFQFKYSQDFSCKSN